MFLMAGVIFLMTYFIVISNITTASDYRIGLMNEKLAGLIEANGILTAQKLSIEDSSLMLNFAESHNMIEAGYVTHIFESGNVAAFNY